ncbi:bactofilin family protein [Paenibacillus cremeus]|uniref:Polymer-forming cytoskeletal protein n=1 Tax=Paenibacillus cremeus TaxID=2163881 RepID=A0A559K8G6_9BACL|nr:polymer-forming cytoskeletal protein [Paenibacillus cremeus]TVY08422.1 polymer-forming cytoskeletal protein [Paenibacillus cremeus]
MMRFSSKKSRSGGDVSLIGEGSLFHGTLHATSDLRIEGEFQGTLHSSGEVAIGEKGYVHSCEMYARHVIIAGRMEGCIQADALVRITSTGRLTGIVKAPSLIIEQGAVFQGHSEMDEPAAGAALAPVMV